MARLRSGTSEYVKLEQRLVLLAWLNRLFGYELNHDLLADIKAAGGGFDASGHSYGYLHVRMGYRLHNRA